MALSIERVIREEPMPRLLSLALDEFFRASRPSAFTYRLKLASPSRASIVASTDWLRAS